MRRAAIAIGSNSTRMLCADLQGGRMRPICRGREETRLFMGLTQDGALSQEAMDRVVSAVTALKKQAENAGAEGEIALYATSAARDCTNALYFQKYLENETGLTLSIITGEEEAELAYLAVSDGRDTLVIDIGGGSTELTLGQCGAHEGISLQLGASRLLKRFPVKSASDAEALIAGILASPEMARAKPLALSFCSAPVPVRGIGGTMTAYRDIAAADPLRFEGGVLNAKSLDTLIRFLAPMTLLQRSAVPGLPPARAPHIVHGLCILRAVFETFRIESMLALGVNNLDGFLLREARALNNR